MSLDTIIRAGIKATLDGPADSGQSSFALPFARDIQIGSGTGPGKADRIFSDERTIVASENEDLDLAGGVLKDAFGQGLTFVKVKAILIEADPANTNNVVVGGAESNAFVGPFAHASDKIAVPPGGRALLLAPVAGWTVAAGTGDLLTVANSGSGSSVTYNITLVGTSA